MTELAALRVPILGGDVVYAEPAGLRLGTEGWHCEPAEQETPDQFAVRSAEQARVYVAGFAPSAERETLFVLVPG